jgi:AcrR family transcriptional regulator
MSEETPLPQRILDATEAALRRFGVEKTNVVDIARALDMSHGNIYRHFPSKKALLDAVAERWLHALMPPLEAIVADTSRPAAERLTSWFHTLREAKRRKVLTDPEVFRMYHDIAVQAHELVAQHVGALLSQVEVIIAAGIASGEFPAKVNAAAAARACLQAMSPFHHPALMMQSPPVEADARAVLDLLLAGLRAGAV